MKKTAALFATSGVLLAGAIAIDLWSRFMAGHTSTTPPPPPPPKPSPVASAQSALLLGDLVSADVALMNSFVLAGTPAEVFVRVDLTAKDVSGRVRAPMALAVVIDRSGSMAGEKIERARASAKELVGRLDPRDQIALITYATDVSVDLPLTSATERARIERIIDQIFDGGGTNISGGLEAGLAELDRVRSQGLVSRVVLLSDGNANQGIVEPRALGRIAEEARQRGITVSSLGLGLDFNEDVMTMLAENGGGTYHYLRDAAQITAALDDELRGMTALAARRVGIQLSLAPGAVVTDVYGYGFEKQGSGREVTVPIGDMASGSKRRVVFRIALGSAAAGAVPLSGVSLEYAPAEGATTDLSHFSGALSVVATDDANQLRAGERADVGATVAAILAADARRSAAVDFSSGNRGAAVDRLRRNMIETRAKASRYNSPELFEQLRELEGAAQSAAAADLNSEEGRDFVKSEKYKARKIFAY